MFHEPRSKTHWALRVASPFACCAPPRRKECEVKFGVGFALVCASLADLAMWLTYACIFMLSSLVLYFFVHGSPEVSRAISLLSLSQTASAYAKGISIGVTVLSSSLVAS
ncbi:hypothetical protein PHMEG_00018287 [Phytophthora megakarya]|uniref:Uncharacterized protein n=1 Tax=Phytophthora megakarya TaxID=4795 RepID=A0A225VUH1_9STRA|nr:hypothetical protein PHMEG_00018287 [Phytophthora megakarya]